MLRYKTVADICTIVAACLLVGTDIVMPEDVYACSNGTVRGICNCIRETRSVNCDNLNLNKLPQGIPLDSLEITLRNNKLTELDNISTGMKTLIKIDATDNQISKPFYLPRSLEIIVLNKNRLTELGDMLTGMQNMSEIFINENDLKDIPAGTFKGCVKLSTLQANRNKFKVIRRDMFYGMTSSWPATLLKLSLSDMPTLSYIEEDAFVDIGPKLIVLDVSYCNITEIPKNLFRRCTEISVLGLGNNKITELPQGLYKSIRYCTLIDLSNNKITELPEGLFKGIPFCAIINLSMNRLKRLPPLIFQGIAIEHLLLHGNQLEELPEDLLLNTSVLNSLDISGNGLKRIQPNFFHGRLPGHVFMYSNEIEALPKELFRSADCGMRELHIFNNKIKAIEDYTFIDCQNLETLFAFNNKITNITTKTFLTKGRRLKNLNIIQNPVNLVQNGAFNMLDQAAKTYMSCEDMTQLPVITSNSTQVICLQESTMMHLEITITVEGDIGSGMNGHGFECMDKGIGFKFAFCKPCELGFYGEGIDIVLTEEYAGSCKPAPRGGFYQNKIGQTSVEKCYPGTFVLNGTGKSIADCEVCPSGTNTSRSADYRACFCLENFHRTNR